MDAREFSILIEKYQRGECSSQEQALLENYLKSFQNNTGGWLENEMGNRTILEENIYSEIIKNIKKEKCHYVYRIFHPPSLLKNAASIIFFLIIGSGILYVTGIFKQHNDPIVWNEKATSSGEKLILTLSDGSKVTLNADSKLRYPDQFDNTSREVYLEGEAFFEVFHNYSQPFILNTKSLSTTVLGTRFDVSAYPESKTIAVFLLEGKIMVSTSEKGKNNSLVVLKPREKLLYDMKKNVNSFGVFDSLEAVGWKDNIYKFENEPLGNVLRQLERAFGVKFRLADQSVLTRKITIKFENNSLKTVVDVIKRLTGLNYKIVSGNTDVQQVIFFRNAQ